METKTMALVKSEDINWSEAFETNMSEDEIERDCVKCLQKSFGHSKFRDMQWKIVASVLNDRRDNCVIMATGYGKSLCYQFPSIYLNTLTIVVSPLISLMQDQVLALRLNKLRACFLGSAQENRDTLFEVIERKYNIVYVTPEYITSESGVFLLSRVQEYLTLIAIDEAHCISKWGHDFRSAYRNLSRLRDLCPTVPILAMTATATPLVRDDITQSLKLRNPQIISTGFDRPNLEFSVKHKSNVWADIGPHIARVKMGSVIVYCISRRVTEEVAATIKANGHLCGVYHAGLSLTQRKKAHEDFIHDRIRVICATIAFGMGINKPDVRLVIHYGVAKDVESYYQEVGRAGRDGFPSQCMMFYEKKDWTILSMIRNKTAYSEVASSHQEKLVQVMLQYVSSTACRRRFILSYFGENCDELRPRPNCCDNCRRQNCKQNLYKMYEGLCEDGLLDITDESLKLLTLLRDSGGSFGLQKAILILRGSKSKLVPTPWLRHALYGSLCNKSVKWLEALSSHLQNTGMIATVHQQNKGKCSYSTYKITANGLGLLNTGGPLRITPSDEFLRNLKIKVNSLPKILTATVPENQMAAGNGTPSVAAVPPKLESSEPFDIYRPLLKVRTKLASLFDVMPYLVASTKALQQLATLQPTSMDELRILELDGYSEEKIERFGPVFLKVIRDFHAKVGKSVMKESASMANTITRHLIVPDSSGQPSTSASNFVLGPVKEESKPTLELPESPKPDTTADINENQQAEEATSIPNTQDSVKVIESTPPPVIEISDSEEESEYHEAWQSGIRDSELLAVDEEFEKKSNHDSSSDVESEEMDLLIAAIKTESLYSSQITRNAQNDANKEPVSSSCSRKNLPENDTSVSNHSPKASDVVSVSLSLTPSDVDSASDVFDEFWDPDINDKDLTQISESAEQHVQETSAAIPAFPAGSHVPSNDPERPSVTAEFPGRKEIDFDLNDQDLTQVFEKTERQIPLCPANERFSSKIPTISTALPSVNSAASKVTRKEERTELDLFLDEVNLDLDLKNLPKEPQSKRAQKTAAQARVIKKNSNAFQYEDDSSSESEGERRPAVTTPKKRALPSWMQLANKRKR